MLKIFKLFISFVFFGICIGLPIKDQEIDELIYRLQELKHQSRYNGGNEEIITNQIHDDGPRSWDALFGYQNRIDDIGLRNVQPYFGSVARRSMKQVDRLGGGILLRPSDPLGSNNGDNTPDEAEEPIRNLNTGQNIVRGIDRIQLRSLDHIGGGNLLKRSLDHIGGGNLLKRSLDSIGGGHLLKRAVDSIGGGYLLNKSNTHPIVDLERKPLLYDYYANTLNPINDRRLDGIDRVGMVGLQKGKRNFDEIDRSSLSGFNGKRNFDEIDRSGLSGFNGKRNFDEIDRSGLSAFHVKRNFDEIDRSGLSGFNGKRNFDEIDRSGLSGFHGKRNFDEIDRSGLSGLHKKRSIDGSERYYQSNGADDLMNRYYNDDRDVVKRNFDEIDRSGLSGFHGKRNFDEIDRFGPGGFLKRNFQREMDEISRLGRGSQFIKRNFDEIDRFGFDGLKRNTAPKTNN